jgi:hypothetical protein
VADEGAEFTSCDVCGRTILRGERVYVYVVPRGGHSNVCALCRATAERSGWIPAELAGAVAEHAAQRRPRGQALRERLERAASRAREALPTPAVAEAEPEPAGREAAPPPPPPRKVARTPERVMAGAIDAFNRSHMPRRVAGLIRSLGQPRVAVRPAPEGWVGYVTVAWELSWYQWEIRMNEDDGVEEIAKGDEMSELSEDARQWNATAEENGTLRLGA